ncbi:MAG: DUF3810 domain-containing protein [Ferruginibacter sp.]|nr:DUF3810 domain-containing protein [Ferruginibacter sp.]
MKQRKTVIIMLVLLLVCIAIHYYSINENRVEVGYTTSFYPVISNVFRLTFGWLPFSVGDFLWGILVFLLIQKLFYFIRFLFSKRRRVGSREKVKETTINTVIFCSAVYILFNIFWGINYNRVGIAHQLGLKMDTYSVEELKTINGILVEKINTSKQTLIKNNTVYPNNASLFSRTKNAYAEVAKKYDFLSYKNASIKQSMWGWLGNYTGFVGYYNPFTGEAQVNTTVPKFTQPFTACHEVAHQLGYAKEMEANFVGYLAASNSTDTLFRYSVYADLFTYANRTLYFADSTSALQYRKLLLPAVIKDFKERRKFAIDHSSFLEPVFRTLYGKFLQSNQQPMGILSYDEVTSFIIAYYKKFGTI